MYKVLDKDTIEMEIVPHIPLPKRGFAPTAPLYEIVNAILYKLKTGVQWEYLPTASLFSQKVLSWQSVYHHYRKWCRSGAFMDCWVAILKRYRGMFDLSSVDLDGSHTPAIKGGEAVEYQGRKKSRTTNALFLTDRQGLPLAMSEPISGNHNDLFDIEVQFEVVTATLDRADIKTEGLFLNADAGFDSKDFAGPVQEGTSMPTYVSTSATAVWMTGTNILIGTFMTRGMPWNAPMHGSTVSGHCSIGSIRPLKAGKGSTTYHS